jgi:hypothetical protein
MSAGQTSVGMSSEGRPYSRMSTEGFINALNRTFEITWDNEAWFNSEINNAGVDPTFTRMFESDRALFMANTFRFLPELRAMESDFGIIPYPKFNENQDRYYARLEGVELFVTGHGASEEDVERTSVILEAMASLSYRTVIPVMYDTVLQTQIARDDESADMLDLIFDNRVIDFGDTIWSIQIRDGVFQGMFMNNDRNIVSAADRMEAIVETQSQRLFDAFDELR